MIPMTGRHDLDAAGITDPALRAGYELCRRLNARHGKTYFLATLLLPPEKRPYVHALYGFARHADDLVDDLFPGLSPGLSPVRSPAFSPEAGRAERARRFTAWSEQFLTDLEWGATSDPVSRAVLDTIARWQIPTGYFADFVDSMRMDLTVEGYPTYAELDRYMWGSAAVVGLQMLPILGRANAEVRWDVLEQHAIALGTAFQLTNFLRDVGEDLRRGRVYLPQESLDAFGVDRERLGRGRVDESIRNLLAAEIERARRLYRAADPGIDLVHPSSRDCLRTARTLYSEILDEIERRDYDVFHGRVVVGLRRRAQVALSGLRGSWTSRRAGPTTPTGSAS
jgi:15-cis-phytoene synthase